MIAFRYLAREVLLTMVAVSAALLVIIMSGRFIRYLVQATQGIIDAGVLLSIMALKIPEFLQMILPLGLFLGFLLGYGRLYTDSEMTILSATGMSPNRLLLYSFAPALVVALLVAFLALYVTPQCVKQVEAMLHQQDSLTEFDTLEAGRFQKMRHSERATYVTELSEDRKTLSGVFISERRRSSSSDKQRPITVLVAHSGRQTTQPDGNRYLILEQGYRFDGNPGTANYRVTRYDSHAVLLPKASLSEHAIDQEAMPTTQLIGSTVRAEQVELQWRFTLPLIVLVVTLLAVPLSHTQPRQGRFLKLVPAILLYMAYLALLISARGALLKGHIAPSIGFWPIHLFFVLLGVLLLYWKPIQERLQRHKLLRKVPYASA